MRIALLIWAFVGPALAGGIMYAREAVVTSGAVKAARTEERADCRTKIAAVRDEINRSASKAVDDARAAADAVTPAPEVPGELVALCRKSASCLERERLP